MLWIAILAGLAGSLLLLPALWAFAEVANISHVKLLGFLPMAFGWMILEYNRRVYLVIQRFRFSNLIEACRAAGSVLIIYLITTSLARQHILGASIWTIGAFYSVTGLAGLLLIARSASKPDKQVIKRSFQRCWEYSKWMLPTAITSRIGPDLGPAVAGITLGSAAVGGYRAMLQLASAFNILFQTMLVSLPVRFSSLYREGGNSALLKATILIASGSFAVCGLTFIFLVFKGQALVTLVLGEGYGQYFTTLLWLTVMYFFILVHNPLSAWLHTLQQSSRLLIPNLLGAATAIALFMPLVDALGVQGVAATLVIMYAVEVAALAVTVFRRVRQAPADETGCVRSQ